MSTAAITQVHEYTKGEFFYKTQKNRRPKIFLIFFFFKYVRMNFFLIQKYCHSTGCTLKTCYVWGRGRGVTMRLEGGHSTGSTKPWICAHILRVLYPSKIFLKSLNWVKRLSRFSLWEIERESIKLSKYDW